MNFVTIVQSDWHQTKLIEYTLMQWYFYTPPRGVDTPPPVDDPPPTEGDFFLF